MAGDEKNETEDLLSRRMSSGSTSAADKSSAPLEAANDPSTDTEAFDPIKDPILKEEPRPSTGPVRVAPAHSNAPQETARTREVPANGAAATTPGSASRPSVMSEEDWAAVTKAATSTDTHEPEYPERRRNPLDIIGTIWIALSVPFMLLALSVRAIASGMFLKFEYFRPGFPADQFGFGSADREHYGTYVIDYLHNLDSRRYLADVVMPNGEPVFISSELDHMADVKGLISLLYLIAIIGFIGTVLFSLYLSRRNGMGMRIGFRLGAIFSFIAMAGLAVVALLGWESFFRGFHRVFFADGTWEFYADDSLIRLFPPQFWVDAGIGAGGIFLLLTIILFLFSFAGHKKRKAAKKAQRESADRI
ncbi:MULTISPECIES: TIGR01906 family membrane protein [Brevibacterium]|nr:MULTISPECIES: TIGR01906 family membrane protein [Brevibacterium]